MENLLCCCLATFVGAGAAAGDAIEFVPPPDAGLFDVKRQGGAAGDGKTDDTRALQAAFQGEAGKEKGGLRALYLPPGTYLVSDGLLWGDKKKTVYGAGRGKTILRLKDRCAGYGDPEHPKFVLNTKGAFGGQNFFIHVRHLTIDVGSGNPGAVGLMFQSNNTGSVVDVEIVSSDPKGAGHTGLDLKQNWPGPGLIKDVEIRGFDHGIAITHDQYGMTFEKIAIRQARKIGFANWGNTCSIRAIAIEGCPLGILNVGRSSLMTLLDATIVGGSGGAAVRNETNGGLLARNLTTKGYDLAIEEAGRYTTGKRSGPEPAASGSETPAKLERTAAGPTVAEWTSHDPLALFECRPATLRLPVRETPEVPYPPPGEWIGVTATGDITERLQAAIDSGKSTVYLPHGGGKCISETITVRGAVARIIGMGDTMIAYTTDGAPAWRIEDGAAPAVVFENIYEDYGSTAKPTFEQATARPLVLKYGGGSYRNAVPEAVLFVEDWVGQPFQLTKMQAWIRDLNTETYDFTHITNDASLLWILGHKTEKDQTVIETRNGGRTELLGALLYKNRHRKDHPAFIVEDAAATFSYRVKGEEYRQHVVERRGGETRTLTSRQTDAGRAVLFTANPK